MFQNIQRTFFKEYHYGSGILLKATVTLLLQERILLYSSNHTTLSNDSLTNSTADVFDLAFQKATS